MRTTSYEPEQCTQLGNVGDYRVFENPEYGDEAPILAEIGGELVELDVWDASDADEVIENIEDWIAVGLQIPDKADTMLTEEQIIDRILNGYIGAVLHCESDKDGDPLCFNFGTDDFHTDTYYKMRDDCGSFYRFAADFVAQCGLDYEDIGVNFYLDRQGHGAGFLDREDESKYLIEAHACRDLHEIARGWPEFHVWVGNHVDYGDDGKIHEEAA